MDPYKISSKFQLSGFTLTVRDDSETKTFRPLLDVNLESVNAEYSFEGDLVEYVDSLGGLFTRIISTVIAIVSESERRHTHYDDLPKDPDPGMCPPTTYGCACGDKVTDPDDEGSPQDDPDDEHDPDLCQGVVSDPIPGCETIQALAQRPAWDPSMQVPDCWNELFQDPRFKWRKLDTMVAKRPPDWTVEQAKTYLTTSRRIRLAQNGTLVGLA